VAQRPFRETWLHTFVASRDLHVLVFDGESAALKSTGTLDTQEVLLARKGGVHGGRGWWDEYTRLDQLCKWAEVCPFPSKPFMNSHKIS
jgi:hypothetical protein